MEPVIKSKEKCLHCIYGVTGECDMYDDFNLPEDGEKCYNYAEDDDEEMADGDDIKIEDCIGFLKAQAEAQNADNPKRNLYNMSVQYLNMLLGQHEEDVMWMSVIRLRNEFWTDFIKYITDKAVGDKLSLIQTVRENDNNWSGGYVKVEKRIGDKQELLLDFTTSKGEERTATWQASDNYAVWQTCGMVGDDYSRVLLMPTYKDDEYFCIIVGYDPYL